MSNRFPHGPLSTSEISNCYFFLFKVRGPAKETVLSKFYASEGRFTFTSHTPGEHSICLHTNSTSWSLFSGGKLRVHLEILVGEHANDYEQIAAKDKLTELQLRMRQLLDQVDQITKEQAYQVKEILYLTSLFNSGVLASFINS